MSTDRLMHTSFFQNDVDYDSPPEKELPGESFSDISMLEYGYRYLWEIDDNPSIPDLLGEKSIQLRRELARTNSTYPKWLPFINTSHYKVLSYEPKDGPFKSFVSTKDLLLRYEYELLEHAFSRVAYYRIKTDSDTEINVAGTLSDLRYNHPKIRMRCEQLAQKIALLSWGTLPQVQLAGIYPVLRLYNRYDNETVKRIELPFKYDCLQSVSDQIQNLTKLGFQSSRSKNECPTINYFDPNASLITNIYLVNNKGAEMLNHVFE
jgi:hypothetical protein